MERPLRTNFAFFNELNTTSNLYGIIWNVYNKFVLNANKNSCVLSSSLYSIALHRKPGETKLKVTFVKKCKGDFKTPIQHCEKYCLSCRLLLFNRKVIDDGFSLENK